MSKFIDAVKEQFTGNVSMIFEPLKTTLKDISSTSIEDPRNMREYNIEVRWGSVVECEPRDLSNMLKNFIRELKEVVYGDLRNRIIDLERSLYQHDEEKMRMLMRDILREIFE